MASNEISIENTLDPWSGLDEISADELGKLLDEPLPSQECFHLRTNEQHTGFDSNYGKTWIYPSNLPCRSYQYSITHAALFQNTLVVLPTGLGKTFIAAVVMYNIYRWYPNGKVIFMAPTRPLVAQQIEACQRIMAFPMTDTVELTGRLQRERRFSLWRSKRVFFATPQVVQADMMADTNFPFEQVKLLVIDEAHKARGRYAYTEVVQKLRQHNRYFRVLALSATPGRTMEDVAEMVRNLFISHLEVRWDTSIDVVSYVHQRSMKTIVVHLSEEIKRVHKQLIQIIDPYLRQLVEAGVVSGSHQHITRNFLLFEQKRFRERSQQQHHPQQAAVNSNFSICISLFHSLELLERHGLRVFLNSFEDEEDGRPKFVLTMNPYLRELVTHLREELGPNPFDISAHAMTNGRIADLPKNLDFGHPKYEKAREALLKHFQENPDSRAIVFCEYRESVMLIHRLLLQHRPMLKPRCLVGQGGATGPLRALSQKQQVEIMNDFRSGKSNILIATSIGEEGLDVGEVDLIVCFDMCTSNPTRFIQRIGRTGRKKQGHVVILVTEGKEQQILKEVLAQKDQTNKKLLRSPLVKSAFYKESPRLVPPEYNPECVKAFMKPIEEEVEAIPKKPATETKSKKAIKVPKTKEKLIESTQDLRKFFKKVQTNADKEDVEVFEPTQIIVEQSMDKVKKLFNHLNVESFSSSSNTQLLETQLTPELKPSSPTKLIRLEINELKRINKFLKSSQHSSESQDSGDFLKLLKSSNFSLNEKKWFLKSNFRRVSDIVEKMNILEVLEMEDDASMEEKEIRESFEAIMKCFKDRNELERLLEDAGCEAHEREHQETMKSWDLGETDMTNEEFEYALKKVFHGLNVEGNNCDSFDYRQEELKKTKAYTKSLQKVDESKNDVIGESLVFDPKTDELNESNFTITDFKYSSQWEKDFEDNRVPNKSTPLHGALMKAFQRQKDKNQNVKKKLETIMEQNGNPNNTTINRTANSTNVQIIIDNDDDVEVVMVSSDESDVKNDDKPMETIEPPPIQEDLRKLQQAIENSFILRQQSTPIQNKVMERKSTIEEQPSLEHEFDLDFDQFDEPLPEELELLTEQKNHTENSNRAKENSMILNSPMNFNKANDSHSPMSLFSLLESKPTNSVMTPKLTNTFRKNPATSINSSSTPEFQSPKLIKTFNKTPEIGKTSTNLPSSPEFHSSKFTITFTKTATSKTSTNSPSTPEFQSSNLIKTFNKTSTSKTSTNSPSTQEFQSSKLIETFNKTPAMGKTSINSSSTPEFHSSKLINTSNKPPTMKTSTNLPSSPDFQSPKFTSTAPQLNSPKNRPNTSGALKKYETSPSILNTYAKGIQRMESLRRLQSKNLENVPSNGPTTHNKVISPPTVQDVDSPIVQKPNKKHNLKRKILDSETESEATPARCASRRNSDSDFEEIVATQRSKRRCISRRREKRLKRARLCSFFEHEANKSGGSGHTTEDDEDGEGSLENFVCDSVIVADDDHDASAANAPTTTQMQAIYLQSVRSPNQHRGGFKIPDLRTHNRLPLDIYSQEVPLEPSQYGDDSFVVNEGDATVQRAAETTLCPLERAERILKERKREAKRRRQKLAEGNDESPLKKRKRKCYQINDDSNSSDGIG